MLTRNRGGLDNEEGSKGHRIVSRDGGAVYVDRRARTQGHRAPERKEVNIILGIIVIGGIFVEVLD